jgi:hypothetical protein
MENLSEIKLPTMGSIKLLIEPIFARFKNIELAINSMQPKERGSKKYYRNADLKYLLVYRQTPSLNPEKLEESHTHDWEISICVELF